jgi:anaerobic ribonucleoside-triphosphate reductase activating protein
MRHSIQLHAFLESSRANGPGRRAVVWVQGCSIGCPGCFNPATHPPHAGKAVPVDDLFARIQAAGPAIEGVTLSGGEPLEQRPAVLDLLERLRSDTALSTLVFTGFTLDQVRRMPDAGRLLRCIDVLVAGPYDAARPVGRGLLGSANQEVHLLTPRYTPADLEAVPELEIVVGPTGEVGVTGIAPPDLRW